MSITSQVLEQVDPVIKAVCNQAKNVVVFRVSPANAKELADVFDTTPPLGEPTYEMMMREVRYSEKKVWWEPVEAEQQCKDIFFELQELTITQYLLGIFSVKHENTLYEKRIGMYQELLPLAFPPVLATNQIEEITEFTRVARIPVRD